MKPLDEKRRDSVLAKILKIGNRSNEGGDLLDAAKELKILKKNGYDVDSYFILFWSFIQRYGQKE
jgi:hypothetical protein